MPRSKGPVLTKEGLALTPSCLFYLILPSSLNMRGSLFYFLFLQPQRPTGSDWGCIASSLWPKLIEAQWLHSWDVFAQQCPEQAGFSPLQPSYLGCLPSPSPFRFPAPASSVRPPSLSPENQPQPSSSPAFLLHFGCSSTSVIILVNSNSPARL